MIYEQCRKPDWVVKGIMLVVIAAAAVVLVATVWEMVDLVVTVLVAWQKLYKTHTTNNVEKVMSEELAGNKTRNVVGFIAHFSVCKCSKYFYILLK